MLGFFFSDANLPFSIVLTVILLLGIIEALALVTGLSLMGLLKDLDMADVDADVAGGGLTGLLGWLCLNRLPLLIWLVLAMTCFVIAGFSLNFLFSGVLGYFLPGWMSVPLALLLAAFGCRYLGSPLAQLLPKNETSAVSIDDLSGCIATITLGRAVKGNPSEALVRDRYKQKHYVLVEPDEVESEFTQGTQVVLLRREGRVWAASKFN
ncbi:OB-fold-containig protein [Shewanella sp.]|uniref:OB-fold-containig protein n=1 Tax=Shewanella sp. TaxID=50422 RepID=UPI00356B12BF